MDQPKSLFIGFSPNTRQFGLSDRHRGTLIFWNELFLETLSNICNVRISITPCKKLHNSSRYHPHRYINQFVILDFIEWCVLLVVWNSVQRRSRELKSEFLAKESIRRIPNCGLIWWTVILYPPYSVNSFGSFHHELSSKSEDIV